MPTPEEIKKIAREYAESANTNKPYHTLSDGEKKLRDFGVEQVYIPLLEWLSKDYCIVPKKAVAEWVNDIEFFMPDKRSVTMLKIGAKSLFGKSLFEE